MRMSTASLLILGLTTSATLAQSPSHSDTPMGNATPQASPSANCPPGNQATTTGSGGLQHPESQPVERSAILPSAGGHEQSAAPSVQQDGTSVEARSDECPKPPNQLDAPKTE